MTERSRHIVFEHDGHQFEGTELAGGPSVGADPDPEVRWTIHMDGMPALEFRGPYPYRDEDVRARVLEWYAIQQPRR